MSDSVTVCSCDIVGAFESARLSVVPAYASPVKNTSGHTVGCQSFPDFVEPVGEMPVISADTTVFVLSLRTHGNQST
jgi:hypothetical protein